MREYRVYFEGSIIVEANSEDDAEAQAKKEIENYTTFIDISSVEEE